MQSLRCLTPALALLGCSVDEPAVRIEPDRPRDASGMPPVDVPVTASATDAGYYGYDATVPGAEGNSCRDLPDECGALGDESCCTSLLVPGGTFLRAYDGVHRTNPRWPATVSTFRLDKFEISGNRLAAFMEAWNGRWRPPPGSGRHEHLHDGGGLINAATGDFEAGWDPAWALHVVPAYADGDTIPVLLNWYAAYAFCIWDGGFLPSEAEWNYAASGGDEHRYWPWSVPPTSELVPADSAGVCPRDPVGSFPGGYGRWGHANLTGSVWELTLDAYRYGEDVPDAGDFDWLPVPCFDCTFLSDDPPRRVIKGGDCLIPPLPNAERSPGQPTKRTQRGARCARPPVEGAEGGP